MSQTIGLLNMLMSDTPPVCIGESDVTQNSPGLLIQDIIILENSPTATTSCAQNKNIQSSDDQPCDYFHCMTPTGIQYDVDECSSSVSESDSVPSTSHISHINCSSVDDSSDFVDIGAVAAADSVNSVTCEKGADHNEDTVLLWFAR